MSPTYVAYCLDQDAAALTEAYRDLNGRLGSRVLVCQTVPAGTELAMGIVTDPGLGPLVVVGSGSIGGVAR